MPVFPFLHWPRKRRQNQMPTSTREPVPAQAPISNTDVKRHFYNQRGFQCYASFFPFWQGWISAGHVLTDAGHQWPDFTLGDGREAIWPGGLDAALSGCTLPLTRPPSPIRGQSVIAYGYPAGSNHLEARNGTVYLERDHGGGIWIMHILTPDEPVVSGMSGGPVVDAATGEPLGILITRNSPADLNADRDPDESCDFVALSAVWSVMKEQALQV